jgi:hypothetical protein
MVGKNNKSHCKSSGLIIFFGGAEGDRTPDLTAASRALSQLSYSPTSKVVLI